MSNRETKARNRAIKEKLENVFFEDRLQTIKAIAEARPILEKENSEFFASLEKLQEAIQESRRNEDSFLQAFARELNGNDALHQAKNSVLVKF